MLAMVPELPTGRLNTAEVEADGRPALQLESKDQSCPMPSHNVAGKDGVWAMAGIAAKAAAKQGNIFILYISFTFSKLCRFPNDYKIHIKNFF